MASAALVAWGIVLGLAAVAMRRRRRLAPASGGRLILAGGVLLPATLLIALLLRVLPRTPAGLAVTAFVSALVSVVVASQGFVLQYWLGGTTDLGGNLTGLAGTMAFAHLLIGIGAGLITATTVVTVAKVRPDLVYALRALKPVTPAPAVPVAGGAR